MITIEIVGADSIPSLRLTLDSRWVTVIDVTNTELNVL